MRQEGHAVRRTIRLTNSIPLPVWSESGVGRSTDGIWRSFIRNRWRSNPASKPSRWMTPQCLRRLHQHAQLAQMVAKTAGATRRLSPTRTTMQPGSKSPRLFSQLQGRQQRVFTHRSQEFSSLPRNRRSREGYPARFGGLLIRPLRRCASRRRNAAWDKVEFNYPGDDRRLPWPRGAAARGGGRGLCAVCSICPAHGAFSLRDRITGAQHRSSG